MKKFLSAALCAALLLTFAGCARLFPQDTETSAPSLLRTDPTETSANATTEPVSIPNVDLTAISLKYTKLDTTAEDGTTVYSFCYPIPYLVTARADVTQSVTVDLMGRIDEFRSNGSELEAQAQAAYGSDGFTPYSLSVSYTPTRVDAGVLSLYGEVRSYPSGVHASFLSTAVSYDLLTGKELRLSDILNGNVTAEQLCTLLLASLSQQEENLYADYANVAAERVQDCMDGAGGWYFTTTGLCFFFSPYDIAPYSYGVVTAEIPYSALAGLMNDAFPPEEGAYTGTLEASLFTENAPSREYAELSLDREASRVILTTNQAVRDLKIQSGKYDGNTFTPMETVFSAGAMNASQAVSIQADLENTPLLLTYRSGEEIVQRVLTMENHVPVLKK